MALLKGKYLVDGAVSAAKLATDAVETLKIKDANVTGAKLAADAKQAVLESKLLALRVGVLAFDASNASSDTVTTEVLAAANTDTAVGAGGAVSAVAAKGIFVGSVGGANDIGRVIIRDAGTDNGISDGAGDEVYGVLSESGGVYTLSYKKASGDPHTMAGTESLDYYFVEVFDMYSMGVDRMLMGAVNGVVDADTAADLLAHKTDTIDAHAASAIGASAQTNYATGDDVQEQLGQLDTQLKSTQDDLDTAETAVGLNTTHRSSNGSDHAYVGNLQTLSGVAAGAENLGAFTGDTIADNQTIKQAVQALETALENAESNAAINRKEILTLSPSDITAKYKDLTLVPKNATSVMVIPVGGIAQEYTVDFTIITDGSDIKRLNWDGLGLESLLEEGDKIQVFFDS